MKLLIISHNPISTYHNMGKTMLAMFSAFKREELCQFFIYPSMPDTDKCDSYYRITDKDVLKGYIKGKINGKSIEYSQVDATKHDFFENAKDENFYRNQKNKKPFRILSRDLMWKCAHWYNKSLCDWIKKQQPTHIFLAPGNAKFIYDIALKISKKFHLPIITYICDEYYFVEKAKSLLGKLQQKLLKKKIAKLMHHTSQLLTICDELKETYQKEFEVSAQTIMTGSNHEIAQKPIIKEQIRSLVYMGNIRCNRYKSLADIGEVLDEINKEKQADFHLDVYTIEKDVQILKMFESIASIRLCGFISGVEFEQKLHNADLLLHTEAFDEQSIDLVKHSVSTKIADSLGSGVCLFAYGPQQVASMQHLQKNECAIICNDKKQLKETLLTALFDSNKRLETIDKALETAKKYHQQEKNSQEIYHMINRIKF